VGFDLLRVVQHEHAMVLCMKFMMTVITVLVAIYGRYIIGCRSDCTVLRLELSSRVKP